MEEGSDVPKVYGFEVIIIIFAQQADNACPFPGVRLGASVGPKR
jgi:hypothetical protein